MHVLVMRVSTSSLITISRLSFSKERRGKEKLGVRLLALKNDFGVCRRNIRDEATKVYLRAVN